MTDKKIDLKLPSILAFERKLETSDARMYAGNWSDIPKDDGSTPENDNAWKPIPISKRYNRSTQSAHGILDNNKREPNPVSSDDANLPHDKDTLKVSFTLRIIGGLGKPFACNEPNFEGEIMRIVNAFKEKGTGLETLATRYAYNIANGRFLWRNGICAESITIRVSVKGLDNPLVFNACDFSLNCFTKNTNNNDDLKELTKKIQAGLSGNEDFVFMTVIAYVKLGNGQHVFPSQEMNMDKKGKVLFKLDECAAMHNVKIGNALRTIDNWYNEKAEFPIAIEPYGSVTQRGKAHRLSKNDLYTLMENWVKENQETAKNPKLSTDDKNYIVANFIRGGVFSFSKKNKNS